MTVVVRFPRNCAIITGFFFVGISTKRVKWCEEVSLPSFAAFLSTRNQSVLKERLNAERTNPCEKYIPSNSKESECTPSKVSLNCSKIIQGMFGILVVLESCLDASFMKVEASASLRNFVLHMFCERFQAVPALSCPSEVLRQIVVHLDGNDAPFL